MKNRWLILAAIVSLVTFVIIAIKGILTNFSLKYDLIVNQKIILVQTQFFIEFFKIIGVLFDTWSLIIVALIISIFIWIKDSKKDAVFFSVTMIMAGAILFVLKEIFHRARPLDILIKEASYSFPSGHAMLSTIFFGVILYLILKRDHSKIEKTIAKIICPLFIIIISFSRIYLSAHWLSDIFAGFFLGVFILSVSIIIKSSLRKIKL